MTLLNFCLYKEFDVIKSSQTKKVYSRLVQNNESQYEHNKIKCLQKVKKILKKVLKCFVAKANYQQKR